MPSFHLRLPEDLHGQLTDAASFMERSLQREIVFRLRRSFVGEVASARTREVAGAVAESEEGSGPAQTAEGAPAGGTRQRGDSENVPRAPASLPDTAKADRHAHCRRRSFHHIYHRGRVCPGCGFPE